MVSASGLVAALRDAEESSYVRLVADWLDRASRDANPDVDEPALTGQPVIDALAAAAVAEQARQAGRAAPAWTHHATRQLDSFWHPGADAFFAWSLAHSPAEFFVRGLLVERDSLVSV